MNTLEKHLENEEQKEFFKQKSKHLNQINLETSKSINKILLYLDKTIYD